MTDPKHIDAVAQAMHDAEHGWCDDCDAQGIGGPWSEDAAAVLDSSDPAVHAAMLDALTRHGATDDELARRLEWASGLNGHTMLLSLRAEGLDVIATRPEEVDL